MVTSLISDMSIKVKDVQWRNAPLPMGPFNYLHFPDDLSIMIGQTFEDSFIPLLFILDLGIPNRGELQIKISEQ